MSFILAEDAALKNYLQGITVSDEKAPTRPVKVFFGYPDVEITVQTYPYLTIELIDVRIAKERQSTGYMYDSDNRGTRAAEDGKVYGYDMPVPYDLVYQVTTYARHPRHDRGLLFNMQHRFPAQYGSLRVFNEIGTEAAYRHMFLDGFLKRDMIEDGRRLFRNVYTVRIVSEMTPFNASEAVSTVQTVQVNRVTNVIPDGFTPLTHLIQGD